MVLPGLHSFAPRGLALLRFVTHGLRRGLHYDAASRLKTLVSVPTAHAVGCILAPLRG